MLIISFCKLFHDTVKTTNKSKCKLKPAATGTSPNGRLGSRVQESLEIFNWAWPRIRYIWSLPTYPICSMYGIFTNICPINDPNVGKYTINGAYGIWVQGMTNFGSQDCQTRQIKRTHCSTLNQTWQWKVPASHVWLSGGDVHCKNYTYHCVVASGSERPMVETILPTKNCQWSGNQASFCGEFRPGAKLRKAI